MNWFKFYKLAQIEGLQSVITTNQYGKSFFAVRGQGTFDIKDQLKSMGFRYYNGAWGIYLEKVQNNPAMQQQLEQLGIDTSIANTYDPNAQNNTDTPQQPQEQKPVSEVHKTLEKMKQEVEKAISNAKKSGEKAATTLLNYIDNTIDELANNVDETAAQKFIQDFLNFASKFYNYSFGNQMLIWIQRPDASKVAGGKVWFDKFGRQVTNPNNGIRILAPSPYLTKEGQELKKKMPKSQWDSIKDKYTRMSWKDVFVYDISDTEPVPGWEGPNGESPFEIPDIKQKEDNEKTEEIQDLLESTIGWARELNIDIEDEEMDKHTGGYSAGGKIRINNLYDGINKLGTIIHELAHEILHQFGPKEKLTRQQKEIDAETTAYIVMKHYGYELTKSPQYLALWRAQSKDVKDRRKAISNAVKTIIVGLDQKIANQEESVGV